MKWGYFFRLLKPYIPIILGILSFELYLNEDTIATFFNFTENIWFATSLIFLHSFIKNRVYHIILFTISYVFFAFTTYVETIYYYTFKTTFSTSAIFVALDSNTHEAKEFLNFYLTTPAIILCVVILIIMIIILFKIKYLKFKSSSFSMHKKLKCAFFITCIFIGLKLSTLIVYNLPYMFLTSGIKYHLESKKLGDYKNNPYGNFNNSSRLNNTNDVDEKEVYIILIGESTSKTHMSLYNYYRKTTPRLDLSLIHI